MRNIVKTLGFILSILLYSNCNNKSPISPLHPSINGKSIRDIIEEKYADSSIIIGGTTGAWALGTETGDILDREFNYVTPENDFKQWKVHPDPVTWNWTDADAWVGHIVKHNQILRIHSPIGPQCSDWAKDDNRTATELENNMKEFLKGVCQRYNGLPGFTYMDVVNETIINGEWNTMKPEITSDESPWYKIGVDNDKNHTPLYI